MLVDNVYPDAVLRRGYRQPCEELAVSPNVIVPLVPLAVCYHVRIAGENLADALEPELANEVSHCRALQVPHSPLPFLVRLFE
ncbi:hypothetical protein MA03_05025 [Infirmifilum uzonense]|uniref:Uncharacterized protein n=1 Tax=Infirmifilum uzonense TaxID=1550241 RepID=A0A0F7FHI9_9CREN|nr:hypothetical protein MA03_05025 [Infirmifilum uzonense]